MKRIISLVMALALVLTAMVVPAVAENQDVRTVEFWHTLTGVNGAAVEAIADHFNATVGAEKGIVVKAVYQGNDNSEKLKTLAQASDFANFPGRRHDRRRGHPQRRDLRQPRACWNAD